MRRFESYLLVSAVLIPLLLFSFGCTKKPPVVPVEPPPEDTTTVVEKEPEPEPEPEPIPEPEPEPEPEPIPEPVPPPELKTVHFEFDQSSFTDNALRLLRDNAKALQDYPEWRVVIEGHCDERGSTEYNLALGERRANAVYRYYMNFGGVNKEMFVEIISYGEEKPVARGSNEEAWAKNRRAVTVRK